AAAQEAELEHAEHGRVAADAGQAGEHGVLGRGLLLGRLEAVAIALGVLEVQRVHAGERGLVLLEAAGVGQQADALARGDAEGIAALRAHAAGPLDLRAIDDLLARVAPDPQPLSDDDLLRRSLGLPGRAT